MEKALEVSTPIFGASVESEGAFESRPDGFRVFSSVGECIPGGGSYFSGKDWGATEVGGAGGGEFVERILNVGGKKKEEVGTVEAFELLALGRLRGIDAREGP